MGESESQFDNFEDAAIGELVAGTPVDPQWPIVNVTNVNPHHPVLDAGKVQIAFWQLFVLVALAAMDLGLLFGFLVVW